jgi:hypothetical protein
MVKARSRGVGHVISMGEKRKKHFGRNSCREDRQDDLDVDGIIILKRILRSYDGRLWTGLIWLRLKTS